MQSLSKYAFLIKIPVLIQIYYLSDVLQKMSFFTKMSHLILIFMLELYIIFSLIHYYLKFKVLERVPIISTYLNLIFQSYSKNYVLHMLYQLLSFIFFITILGRVIQQEEIKLNNTIEIIWTLNYSLSLWINYLIMPRQRYFFINLMNRIQFSINRESVLKTTQIVFWLYPLVSFLITQAFVVNMMNWTYLAIFFCVLTYQLVNTSQKLWKVTNYIWLLAWGIPLMVLFNYFVDLHFMPPKNHFFFSEYQQQIGVAIGLLLLKNMYRALLALKQYISARRTQKLNKVKEQFFKRRLQLKIGEAKAKKTGTQQNTIESMQSKNNKQVQWQCSICAGSIEDINNVPVSLNCGHIFHESCIRDWINVKISCPNCRAQKQAIL